jgi:hypothetical protein
MLGPVGGIILDQALQECGVQKGGAIPKQTFHSSSKRYPDRSPKNIRKKYSPFSRSDYRRFNMHRFVLRTSCNRAAPHPLVLKFSISCVNVHNREAKGEIHPRLH